jgi:hypothetical protein
MTFRNISVDGSDYLWQYSFDDSDYMLPSRLVFRSNNDSAKRGKLVIGFSQKSPLPQHNTIIGYCPFNRGLPARKDDVDVIINLNRPRFAAELLGYCLEYRLGGQFPDTTLEFNDGIEMLYELGYLFEYMLTKGP